MRTVYEERTAQSREIERKALQANATNCSPRNFGKVCKVLWPFKTAEELSSRAGCAVRTAAYQISGESRPSAEAMIAVNLEMLK